MGLSLAPPLPLARQHSVQPPHLANGRPLSHELLQLGEPPAPTASLHSTQRRSAPSDGDAVLPDGEAVLDVPVPSLSCNSVCSYHQPI